MLLNNHPTKPFEGWGFFFRLFDSHRSKDKPMQKLYRVLFLNSNSKTLLTSNDTPTTCLIYSYVIGVALFNKNFFNTLQPHAQ